MLVGWQYIDSKWYYFNPCVLNASWDYNGENWVYDDSQAKSYGSMYRSEFTPDGYYADENGAWDSAK